MARETANAGELRDEIREYLSATLARAGRSGELRDEEDLLLVLDSLQLLRMVLELETRYGLSIGNGEMTPENLGTVERIAAFIARKKSGDELRDHGSRPR